jgi:hypothetical protein
MARLADGSYAVSAGRVIESSRKRQCTRSQVTSGHMADKSACRTDDLESLLPSHGQSEPYTPFADPHRPEGAEVRS